MFTNPVANNINMGGGLPPSTLDGFDAKTSALIAQAIAKNPNLQLKSFYGLRLYDTARVAAGTALSSAEFGLFANPVGSQ